MNNNRNDFHDKMKIKSDEELLDIINNRFSYQSEAAEAAVIEAELRDVDINRKLKYKLIDKVFNAHLEKSKDFISSHDFFPEDELETIIHTFIKENNCEFPMFYISVLSQQKDESGMLITDSNIYVKDTCNNMRSIRWERIKSLEKYNGEETFKFEDGCIHFIDSNSSNISVQALFEPFWSENINIETLLKELNDILMKIKKEFQVGFCSDYESLKNYYTNEIKKENDTPSFKVEKEKAKSKNINKYIGKFIINSLRNGLYLSLALLAVFVVFKGWSFSEVLTRMINNGEGLLVIFTFGAALEFILRLDRKN